MNFQYSQQNRKFFRTIGSLNIGALCAGFVLGWPTPAFNYLYTEADISASKIYLDEVWMESAMNAGATLGSISSIFLTDIYGRRMSFYLSAGILVVFWIFLEASNFDQILIISAAGMAGFAVGIYSVTAILYVGEISSPKTRGLIGTAVILFVYLGVFVVNLFGYLMDIKMLLNAMVILPIIFFITIYTWMIESPYYLFQRGMVLDAKISLKNLRDCKSVLEIDEEYRSMVAFFNSRFFKGPAQLIRESLCPSSLRPLTLIILPVLCTSQMLGITAVSDYAQNLIGNSYAISGRIVTSFIDVISIILCLLAIERFGRKPLLVITAAGSALCCLMLAIYNLNNEEQCRINLLITDDNVLPVSILCIYYAIYALGLIPVLPIVTSEIFPCRAKTAAVGICTGLLYFMSFCMECSYKELNEHTNTCLAFICFTILGSVGLPFVVALVPETKGKSLVQIQNEMDHMVMVNY